MSRLGSLYDANNNIPFEMAAHAKDVTPSAADVPLTPPCRYLIVYGAGDLVVETVGGETVTLVIPAASLGHVIPLRVKETTQSGTTATNVFAFW